jgi:hypothetical protein
MANTFVEYTGNNSTTNYSITFEYLKEAEVKATLDGTATTDFTFANATTLSFNTAPGSGVKIRIYRETDVSALKATFFAGSAIKAEDLNDNFTQNNFAVEELRESTWDFDTETIKSNETWVSSDTQIATTAAMDARFQDEATETITSSETWPNDDDTIATTAAIDDRIDTAITNDIAGSDGVSITDDGDGTITIGLTDDSVDFDKIKDADQVQLSNQVASPAATHDDNKVFTASAAARRFDNYYQNSAPTTTDGIGIGQVWVDPDDDLTLSVWTGSAWSAITSGGTFTNQPKVVYVDASSGSDDNDGHRISRPKQTIKAAVNQINADSTHGDGSVVIVAAGVYQEAAPIQIQKKNVSIIGQALRSCLVHPTVATQGDQSSGNHALFELNSGSFIQNLTLTGMKAGTGTGNTVDSTLPTNQGWNFAFFSGATITKSPYIQNCTNFSDSEIDNSNLNANTPAGGLAGDTDSAPTGGGMLVDGSVVATSSPLRSMVADSYTHVGLNGPGILVTNNGYTQATSSYAFFNKYHIKTLNGGQANLAASTTDFGDQGLVADGKSTSAIFTSNVDGAASDGATSFNINEPTAGSGWFGDTQRPATNMLVEVNSVIYPILSATANTDSEGGNGWTVTISRPDSNNRSTNLGLNGAISDNAAVSFFLRSMIASSGHTMEYVGSGTDYRALPENGGVPNETKQITESNNGKVWTAITDHNGKFKIGGNQTDDPIFQVDQQLGFVTIPEGSIAFNLLSDVTPQLGGNLDVNGNEIVTDASNENIVLNPHGTGAVNVSSSKIINVTDPTNDQDAATKKYVDDTVAGIDEVVEDATPQLGGNLDVNGNEITSASNGDVTINPNGTGDIILDANVGIGTTSPSNNLDIAVGANSEGINIGGSGNFFGLIQYDANRSGADQVIGDIAFKWNGTRVARIIGATGADTTNKDDGALTFHTASAGSATEKVRIDSSGSVGIGTSTITEKLEVAGDIRIQNAVKFRADDDAEHAAIKLLDDDKFAIESFGTSGVVTVSTGSSNTERMRLDSSGRLVVGASSGVQVAGSQSFIQHHGNKTTSSLSLAGYANNLGGPILSFGGSRSTTVGTPGTIVSSGDHLGDIRFAGDDGTDINSVAASIRGEVDGTPGSNDMPGRLVFSTTADNAVSATERMRITSSGEIRVPAGIGSQIRFENQHSSTADASISTFDDGVGTLLCLGSNFFFSSAGAETRFNTGEESAAVLVNRTGIISFLTNTASATATERMRIDSSGNVGIGTTNPVAPLVVSNSGGEGFEVVPGQSSNLNLFYHYNRGSNAYIDYRIFANTHQFYKQGSSEAMRIDSSGRLLVGMSSALSGGNSQYALIQTLGNTAGATGNARVVIGRGEAATSMSSGDSIGEVNFTDNTSAEFAQIQAFVDGTPGSNDYPGRLVFSTTADSASSPTERMRITSGGDLRIGQTTTSTPAGADVRGVGIESTGVLSACNTGARAIEIGRTESDSLSREVLRWFRNGNLVQTITTTATTVNYPTGSDYRLKENVIEMTGAIDRVKQLSPKRFNFIVEPGVEKDGFIAHELETVVPQAVVGTKDQVDENGNPVWQGVDHSFMVPLLTGALQEAIAKIETLEAKVAALEAN